MVVVWQYPIGSSSSPEIMYVDGERASNSDMVCLLEGTTGSYSATGTHWNGNLEDAEQKCNEDPVCTVLHDWINKDNGLGANSGWRVCKSVVANGGDGPAYTKIKVSNSTVVFKAEKTGGYCFHDLNHGNTRNPNIECDSDTIKTSSYFTIERLNTDDDESAQVCS